MPRVDGSFEVLERINNNAYKINLPREYGITGTFNVADLSPYLEGDTLKNSRVNSSQYAEDDGEQMGLRHKEQLNLSKSSRLPKLPRNQCICPLFVSLITQA